MAFSAYLSIYNDWDALAPALASMLPHIDELVVVDGAYEWMTPFLRTVGKDPERSDEAVYAILSELTVPVRVVSRIWKNEVEKRLAGFEACAERHVFRIDADEIMFFRDGALDRFLAAGAAVGEMEMPFYVVPGWIQATSETSNNGCQSFLFDREQISAQEHLQYLWLVLEADSLPETSRPKLPVFTEPLAFNAHLTAWRTPRTAVQRAGFYVMNYMRKHGVPWIPSLRGRPMQDFAAMFEHITPEAFLDMLRGSDLVTGHTDIGNRIIRPSTLTDAQEAVVAPVFASFLAANGALNRELRAVPRQFVGGMPICCDITSPGNLAMLAQDGFVEMQVSAPIAGARCVVTYLLPRAPWRDEIELPAHATGDRVRFDLTEAFGARSDYLRRTVSFSVWLPPGMLTGSVLCL